MAGSFTKDVVASSLGAEWVGYLMALRNLAGVASGVLLGRWSDSVGRFPCYLLALSCEGVMAVAMVSGFWRTVPERQHAMLLVLATFQGIGNVGSYTLLRALMGDLFEGAEVGVAMSAMGLFASVASTVGFFVGPVLSVELKGLVLLGLWVSAFAAGMAALRPAAAARKRL